MLLIHSELLDSDLALYLVLLGATLFALVMGIGFHEACHAYTANALGDRLPRSQGRVTLNPLAHLDPLGTILMLVVGFGWGKPVQFNPFGLNVSPKTAAALVAFAGPLSNFVIAGLMALPIQLGMAPYINPLSVTEFLQFRVQDTEDYVGLFLTGAVYLNCILGVFNLIPLPPLDGYKVALFLLPDDIAREFAKLDRYGFAPLFVLLFAVPFLTGYSPFADIMGPAVRWLVELFTGVG